jgi:hypothetical protein
MEVFRNFRAELAFKKSISNLHHLLSLKPYKTKKPKVD